MKKDYIHTTHDNYLKRDTMRNKGNLFMAIRRTGGAWRLFLDAGTSSHILFRSESGFSSVEGALEVAREFRRYAPNTITYLIRPE